MKTKVYTQMEVDSMLTAIQEVRDSGALDQYNHDTLGEAVQILEGGVNQEGFNDAGL